MAERAAWERACSTRAASTRLNSSERAADLQQGLSEAGHTVVVVTSARKLAETLAVTDALLYRRGNFNGSWDQLICDALMEVQGAEIAFSPGFSANPDSSALRAASPVRLRSANTSTSGLSPARASTENGL